MAHRIPPEIRVQLEPLVPELPPIGFPEPPPPPDYRATQVEIPLDLANQLAAPSKTSVRRGAFRTQGLKSLSSAMSETVSAAETVLSQVSALSPDVMGRFRTRCSINPASGVVLRVVDYDPGPGESTGQLFPGSGDLEVLGHVVTDDWGYYLFCFEWPYGTTGLRKPDILLQLIQDDDEGVPAVILQSHISWNIDDLYRKDFCIPSHLLDDKPTEDIIDPARIFQYVGNLPVVRISSSGASDGHATSEAGDLVSVKRAPFARGLYLKGSFHDYPSVKYYRINYWTTDNPDGNISSTPLITPLRYYNADFDLITVGPGPVIFPGVPEGAYPVMDGNYNYSHPFGRQYLVFINTRSLKTGKMKTGFLNIQIQGLDNAGMEVTGAVDQMKLRIDDVAPVPEIEPITAGSGAGAGCGFITLNNPSDTFPLTYRVTDEEGHLYKYYFRLFKCHNNQIGANHYSPVYDLTFPLHWYGTEDDPTSTVPTAPDINGWVTVPMPNGGQLFTAAEIADGINFVAVSIELWAVSRSTDGRHKHLHWPRYVEVVGIKYEPAT